jgi:FkbM family methyltransferase
VIGNNADAERVFIEALLKIEKFLERPDYDVREQVTGPICDSLREVGQEVSRTLSDGTLISARYTSKIVRDFIMSTQQRPSHVWEPQTTRALLGFAETARTVLVGGAYIGDHAILMARKMKGKGTVHCFEPSAESVQMLRKNTIQNNLDNVVINQSGLWAENATLALSGEDSHAAPHIALEDEHESFPATSINAYALKCRLSSIDVIVLDIEGGEIEALRGASDFLSQPIEMAPRIIFEVHRSYVDWSDGLQNSEIVQFLKGYGYLVFALRDYNSNVDMDGTQIEIVAPENCWLEGPPHGFNMIAVKDPLVLENGRYRLVSGVSPKLLKHRDPRYHSPLGPVIATR